MLKYLLVLLLISPTIVLADSKITQLTADTAPSSDDLLVTVNDPAGTPANRKVTIANLFTNAPAITAPTLDTGQGANELYDMDQNVLSTSSPTFVDVIVGTEVYDATGWNGDLTVPTKDSVRDKFEALVVGATSWSDIADPTANQTVALAGYTTQFNTTLDTGVVMTINNTDADLTGDTSLLDLKYQDNGDANGFFLRAIDDTAGTPTTVFQIGADGAITLSGSTGQIDVGSGGVRLTDDGDGALTLLGLGNGSDENLTLNLDDTANTVAISSSTGVTLIDPGTIKITTNEPDTKCLRFESPVAADDLKSIWFAKNAFTISSLWCESDQTVTAMLQVDDGTPADVDSVDLTCDSTPPEDTSLDGDATLASGDRLDLDVASVSGTPTWVAICWTGSWD